MNGHATIPSMPTLPHAFIILFFALTGLALGSFGTMLLYRLPKGETIMGRSQCTTCNHILSWHDLIPIFSFLCLGCCCNYCKKKISWRYPFLEAITALVFALLATRIDSGEGIAILFLAGAIYALVLIAFYDFETQKIPDVFIIILLLSALLYRGSLSTTDPVAMQNGMIGAVIPFCFFGGMWLVSAGRWIGSGDILLGTSIGLLLGMELTLLSLFFTYVIGALFALILMSLHRIKRGQTMPFGPFLASGALIALFGGEFFLDQYWRLLL